jgi:hypothetical protein
VALIIVIGAVAIWNFYLSGPSIEPASEERMAYPLPDKPSIAVLPFVNMSEDPKQEFFCDGLTEEIISALSRNPRLFVIARNSTFTYKGKPVKVQHVSEDLGVRHILEGSVRKVGDRSVTLFDRHPLHFYSALSRGEVRASSSEQILLGFGGFRQ